MLQTAKLQEQSFLVYGLGLSGLSVVKFLRKNKIKNFEVWDDTQKKILKRYRSKNINYSLNKADYIIVSPGISLIKNEKLKRFKKKIITDIDLFYLANKKLKSIVVTGTNGKSTTCEVLRHLLQKNKFKCALGGNIGTPILNIKNSEDTYVIIEASSFQLSHSKFICPNYALLLNLSNDHLDWHGNMKNYLNSKLKIFKLQKKNHYAIINKKFKKIFINNKYVSKLIIPNNNHYKKIKKKIENEYLTSNINDDNMNFIFSFSKLLGIGEKPFIKSMTSFKGLPHRFEIFLKKKNTIFINDSKATSFTALKAALKSLNNIYLILGGLPKKGDKINLFKFKKKIIKCYLIGNNINFFKNQIKGIIDFSITKNLKNSLIKIIKDAKLLKDNNKTILLSPSAASYDQFSNFEERGKEFKRLCLKYVKKFN